MKKLMTLILAGALLALVSPTYAWVAMRAGFGYRGGYACGGVCTGTRYAYGTPYLTTGAVVTTAPVYVAPAYSYSYPAPPPPPPPLVNAPPPGTVVYTLPPGAQSVYSSGRQYYLVNNVYYQPFFGNNGVFYEVVAGPS